MTNLSSKLRIELYIVIIHNLVCSFLKCCSEQGRRCKYWLHQQFNNFSLHCNINEAPWSPTLTPARFRTKHKYIQLKQ